MMKNIQDYHLDLKIFQTKFLPIIRKSLILCFIISIIIHSIPLMSNLKLPKKKIEVKRKPLSVKFIQRAPRLIKPLELAKRPTIVQKTLSRKIMRTTRSVPRSMRTATIHGGTVLASLAPPEAPIDRSMLLNQRLELGPELIAENIAMAKESKLKSLPEDLLNVRDLDTGRFKAVVVQNPYDKKNVSGFFHMDQLYVNSRLARDWDGNPGWNSEPTALPNVQKMVDKVTNIKMDLANFIRMDSEELLNSPMVLLTGESIFDYTKAEAENLGRYLRNGGFLFFDDSSDIPMHGSPIDRIARQLIKEALGDDIVFEKLPNDHRLYHCFFDFNGPPMGFDYRFSKGTHTAYDYLEGVFIDGRLVVLISNKAYCKFWDHAYMGETSHGLGDPTRQLHFGVNIVVFALTQPGGIVQRQMQYR
jgi:hypothetical protein